jgi:predicted transcriptional regulator
MTLEEKIDYYSKNTNFPRDTIKRILENQEYAKKYLSNSQPGKTS